MTSDDSFNDVNGGNFSHDGVVCSRPLEGGLVSRLLAHSRQVAPYGACDMGRSRCIRNNDAVHFSAYHPNQISLINFTSGHLTCWPTLIRADTCTCIGVLDPSDIRVEVKAAKGSSSIRVDKPSSCQIADEVYEENQTEGKLSC